MDKENHEWKSCGRKHSYFSYGEAKKESTFWWRKERKILEIYKCCYCHCFHLTKKLYEKEHSL